MTRHDGPWTLWSGWLVGQFGSLNPLFNPWNSDSNLILVFWTKPSPKLFANPNQYSKIWPSGDSFRNDHARFYLKFGIEFEYLDRISARVESSDRQLGSNFRTILNFRFSTHLYLIELVIFKTSLPGVVTKELYLPPGIYAPEPVDARTGWFGAVSYSSQ